MTLEQLEAFLSISRTGSFSKSAQILHIAQSSITSRIQALEESLGQPLFLRSTRILELSAAGAALLPYAEQILELTRHGRNASQQAPVLPQRLSIAGHESLWAYSHLENIRQFREKHPEVSLRITTGHSANIIQHIADRIVDAGILYAPPVHPRLIIEPYYDDQLLFVASPSAPPSPHPFHMPNYIHIDWGPPFTAWFDHVAGSQHHSALFLDRTSIMLHLLLTGNYYGFLLESIAKPYLKENRLVLLPLKEISPPPVRSVSLVYHTSIQDTPLLQLARELLNQI